MVDALIFDIGNVLLRFDFSLVTQRIAPFCATDASSIHSLLAPLKEELESGRMEGETFLQEASRIIGYTGERSLFRAAWQEIFTPIEATHRLVEQLHHSRPLFLLSNTNDLHDYSVNVSHEFNRATQFLVLSTASPSMPLVLHHFLIAQQIS